MNLVLELQQPGVLVKDYNDFKTHLAYPVGDSSSYTSCNRILHVLTTRTKIVTF
jgi:hypothetical protein